MKQKGREDRRIYGCRFRITGLTCDEPATITADTVDKYVEREFLRRVGK